MDGVWSRIPRSCLFPSRRRRKLRNTQFKCKRVNPNVTDIRDLGPLVVVVAVSAKVLMVTDLHQMVNNELRSLN